VTTVTLSHQKETQMFDNVLVGVDGRPTGRDAIALARRLVDPDGVLTLAHAYFHQSPEQAEAPLEDERRMAGVDAQLITFLAQTPGRGLHLLAEREQADLLVVGSCIRGAFGRATLGDDTRAALNGAPCAVAVAPRGYALHDRPIRRVGVAYTATPESVNALAAARQLAAANHATVHVLQVVTLPSTAYAGFIAPGLGETIDAMLEDARTGLHQLSGVETRAVYGLAGEELAAFGDEVDVLVTGSRGYGPIRRLMVGSTCDYLERHARCPLLVLPRNGVAVELPAAAPAAAVEA
jgi:nucleotide-binding universal stress UspA family protein